MRNKPETTEKQISNKSDTMRNNRETVYERMRVNSRIHGADEAIFMSPTDDKQSLTSTISANMSTSVFATRTSTELDTFANNDSSPSTHLQVTHQHFIHRARGHSVLPCCTCYCLWLYKYWPDVNQILQQSTSFVLNMNPPFIWINFRK